MGWLFRSGSTRRGLIAERIEGWERTNPDGLAINSTCLAHCYRGGSFSGVLWSVWERTFTKDGEEAEPTQRWIQCDLLRYSKHDGAWGYKDLEEMCGPYYFSCPMKYLGMVPINQYGGNASWREQVVLHHQRSAEKRRARRAARSHWPKERRITMPRYRVEALEKFVVRTVYCVEADSSELAEQLCKSGETAYEQKSIEEGDEEWLETVSVEPTG